MVYRLSWIAGLAGIGLALLRMERLLLASVDGLPWEIVIAAAAVLGAAVTWSGAAYRLSGRTVFAVNLVGAVLTVFRIAVPATTWALFPTGASFPALRVELAYARDVIRSGVAPVIPSAGVIAIAAVVFWLLGALVVWGLLRNHPYVAVLPPLVVYLQFATMDRAPSGHWSWWFLVLLGFTLLAVAYDRRRSGTGVATSGRSRLAVVRSVPSLAIATLAVTLAAAALTTNAMAGLVPPTGLLEWRVNTGLGGEYYGSISVNPFVGIRQDLVSQSEEVMFVAEIDGDVDPGDLYFRLLTLDTFGGEQWYLSRDAELEYPGDRTGYEDAGLAFKGPTRTVTQSITIFSLRQQWIPAVYAPRQLTAENRAVEGGFQIKPDDGSLIFNAPTYQGMSYRVVSDVPDPDLDVLSRRLDGTLSPLFAAAAESGDSGSGGGSRTAPPPVFLLEDQERFLALPRDVPMAEIAALAAAQTRGLETDFERALALEMFFRNPGIFTYTTDIDPGHAAEDLTAWLLDPESPNFRTGYCEQFATAMAVMARQLGIPSRVVLGFAPGSIDDGTMTIEHRNAHAWVELWMPTQGWVRFDPTPRGDGINPSLSDGFGFPVGDYLDSGAGFLPGSLDPPVPPQTPIDPGPLGSESPPPIGPEPAASTGSALGVPAWVPGASAAAIVALGSVPALKWIRRRRRLRRLARGDISAAWREIVDRLTDLGAGPSPASTPAEFATGFDAAMAPLAGAYGSTLYGPELDGEGHRQRVAVAVRSLEETEARVADRFSRWRRTRARYRIATLISSWPRRRGRSRRLPALSPPRPPRERRPRSGAAS